MEPADPQRDLLVPFTHQAVNANDGFDQQVGTSLRLQRRNADGTAPFGLDAMNDIPGVEWAVTAVWEDDECSVLFHGPFDDNDALARTSVGKVAPGDAVSASGYLVFKNFRSPAAPDGDLAMLDRYFLTIPTTDARGPDLSDATGEWLELPDQVTGLVTTWAAPLRPAG